MQSGGVPQLAFRIAEKVKTQELAKALARESLAAAKFKPGINNHTAGAFCCALFKKRQPMSSFN